MSWCFEKCRVCGKERNKQDFRAGRAVCRSCGRKYQRSEEFKEKRRQYRRCPERRKIESIQKRNKHQQFPLAAKAGNKIRREIRSGRVKRQPCQECGAHNGQAHHPNYRYPLVVVWLCPQHHSDLHRVSVSNERG